MFLSISGTSKVDWFGFCFVSNLTHMQSFVQLFLTLGTEHGLLYLSLHTYIVWSTGHFIDKERHLVTIKL